jgi:hypothetical protein
MDTHDIDVGAEGRRWLARSKAISSEHAGKPSTSDAHDTYDPGRGPSRGYAEVGCRCTLCMGETLSTSLMYSMLP